MIGEWRPEDGPMRFEDRPLSSVRYSPEALIAVLEAMDKAERMEVLNHFQAQIGEGQKAEVRELIRAEGVDATDYEVLTWPYPHLARVVFPILDRYGRLIGKEELSLRQILLPAEIAWSERRKVVYIRLP